MFYKVTLSDMFKIIELNYASLSIFSDCLTDRFLCMRRFHARGLTSVNVLSTSYTPSNCPFDSDFGGI